MILRAAGLTFIREGVRILDGVDLVLAAGERVALTGPSGSGKTTLMSLLAGLAEPDAGFVSVAGRPRIGVIFQGYALVALLTAAENIELPLVASGVGPGEAADRAAAALDLVGLADRTEHLVEELSGGQQQRVAIARTLAARPDVILADEPTAEQDPAHRVRALDAILGAADAGAAVLLATHEPALTALCDRHLHLSGGRLVELPRAAGGP